MPHTKALFLDRDGVINIDHGYVHRMEDFTFVDGIFELCQHATSQGYLIIVVTNQAGIGRGYYSEAQYQQLTKWYCDVFSENNITISKVYHCPYHVDAALPEYKKPSEDRKPNPGMLLKAKEEFNLHMPSSLIIGDKMSDMEAGKRAGIGKGVLIGDPIPQGASDTNTLYITRLQDAIPYL